MDRYLTKLYGSALAFGSAFFFFSSVMYTLQGSNDKWFSRTALAFVCLGFYYVGKQMGLSR